ncbi:MAG: ribonuclease P protein component [Bacteroidales bacterium]|nr:ribonuclease P protein component [Bacteroidales bacterium]
MTAKEGLPKYERICKENDIQTLFDKGVGFPVYPYRVIFLFHHDESRPVTCRLLVSVSKKRFHHAIKRNRVKRLIREAWRKNKAPLYEICCRDNISVDVALVYTATVIHSYEEMFAKTQKAVNELIKKYNSAKLTHHEAHPQSAR